MAPANTKTHKDMSLPRVPVKLVKLIERDAAVESLSTSALIRRILLKHYGLLNGQPTAR